MKLKGEIKFVRQREGLCGPTSLYMILKYYGIRTPLKKVVEVSGATDENGTDHYGIIRVIEKFGFRYAGGERTTLGFIKSAIRYGWPVIVGWWKVDGDHFSVVYGITDNKIYLIDPEEEKTDGRICMSINEFLNVWYDTDGDRKGKIRRWAIAVIP